MLSEVRKFRMVNDISVPSELSQHAANLGFNISYVQGPGGNVSIKQDGILWIKASGTRMAEALERDIFVGLDVKDAAKIAFLDDSRQMLDAVIHCKTKGLRPSIETAMHAIIPARVVSHVHSVGSVAVGVQKDPSEAISIVEDFAPIAKIPYVRPGAPLAKAIAEVLEPQHKGLLLGNHGLTVWGDSVDETEDLITRIENCWRVGATDNFPEKKTDFVGRAESHWIDALSKGILVPDEAVLLGPRAFYSGNDSLGGGIFFDEMNIGRPGTQLTEDAIDIARMLIAVGQHVKKDSELNYLSEEQVAELLDWDMEKFRQEMSK